MTLKLWKYNKITGLWKVERAVSEDTKNQWLTVFQNQEPNEFFKISKVKPKTVMK